MDQRKAFEPHRIKSLKPVGDGVIACDMQFDIRLTSSGILLPNDDMKSSGIRPRWAKVYAIGPDQNDVKIGQYILISHGRWSRGVKIEDDEGEKVIRKVDPNDILLVSDDLMQDETMGDKVI